MMWDTFDNNWDKVLGNSIGGLVTQGFADDGASINPAGLGSLLTIIGGINNGTSYKSIAIDDFNAIKTSLYDETGAIVSAIKGLTDNTAFTDGTSKVYMSGHIFDEVAGTALTENDAAASRVDSKRAQVFVIEDETTRGRRTTVTAGNALKVDNSAVTQPISAAQTATTVSTDTEVSVTTNTTALLAANANRKKVFIQNHGSGYVRVRLAATALTTSPIRLVPQVGTYELKSEDGFVYRGVINAISESGTNLVGVIEET